MGESNGDWGEQRDDSRAAQWDQMSMLPERGEDRLLDAFLDSRRLAREDLTRIGTRITSYGGHACLVWLFPDGFKYRRLVDGRRYSEDGVRWKHFKRVRAPGGATEAFVAEGETDAATIAKLFPGLDVYITPNGAKNITPEMVQALAPYERVYVGYDNDEAGEAGARELLGQVPRGVRVLPPGGLNDWSQAWSAGAIPNGWDLSSVVQEAPRNLFSLKELVEADLGTYSDNHYFERPILPLAGTMVIHAQKKSGKSFVALELMRAITTGTPFAGYIDYARSAPARVGMYQMEIPPFDFRARIISYSATMGPEERHLFLTNGIIAGMANNQFPRIKVTAPGFQARVLQEVEQAELEVVIFDPIQRMLASANANQMHEIDVLLGLFERLNDQGCAVIYCAHNNKSDRDAKGGHAIAGSQRFSGDPDAICSLYFDNKSMIDDDNAEEIKQRAIHWELRSGSAPGRCLEIKPAPGNPQMPLVTFSDSHGIKPGDTGAPEM
jgi:hypothetical protein